MTIYAQVSQLIGNTPLIELTRFEADHQLPATLLGKVESSNPGGSIKDRVAQAMLDEAEASGKLSPDTVIIEPTSGNTGVGLAMLAATRGNQIIICMPETMSVERRNLMRAYGAQLELTEGSKGMAGAIARAEELAQDIPNAFIPSQFSNPANPAIHYRTTGPEIWEQAEGDVDALVCGVGTGGTISGAGAYLKEQNPNIQIIAVEPAGSPVLSGGKPGPHGLQGIGAGFVPATLDTRIYGEVIQVHEEDAYETGRALASRDGLLVGISSGAAVWAASQVAQRPEMAGKRIVCILPDTGERYLSTPMFS